MHQRFVRIDAQPALVLAGLQRVAFITMLDQYRADAFLEELRVWVRCRCLANQAGEGHQC